MRNPVVVKVMAVLATVLLISVVLARIGWLVDERQVYQHEAVDSVQQSYAGAQTLMGPVLQRQCVEEWEVVQGSRTEVARRGFALQAVPAELVASTKTQADARYRGLFKVNGYNARLELQARWPQLAVLQPRAENAGGRVSCQAPTVWVAVSDPRGLRSARIQLAGRTLELQPGTGHKTWKDGLHAGLPAALADGGALELNVTLDLVGTAELAVVPAARSVQWTLAADWPHPSFGGRFLPVTREVRDDGFDARWSVSALASNAAQIVEQAGGEKPRLGSLDTLAVTFTDPVNPYVLADRAIKYGLLFVVLTFAAVALAETLARRRVRRVHPVQYALVGLALALFFLLLLALSEQLPFAAAYGLAAAACVLLLGSYGRHMLGGVRDGWLFGAGMALLYGLLYLLLLREQTALLVGSLGLFAALAAVMLLTRRLDWYRLGAAPAAPEV
ncbi:MULTISPECIES: cell envelope integrity protein CreD [unclassified Rubrivivax]|uniref:cell envelope integrity protein CreD n=1 Tax=unclassified Rubrivivax TaxID=2649762 RepID=UPI001E34D52F|nr:MULTISPECIES: cell envelope integrity protein CreD [unclassified Rubrivivax]MCC9598366.1 cell envelope integrity protein CreD [Rubrivivax sp. JA1055]MCC9648066.1 cell envelope integrity protein CreD [Rubrivivax sp. JA1029]